MWRVRPQENKVSCQKTMFLISVQTIYQPSYSRNIRISLCLMWDCSQDATQKMIGKSEQNPEDYWEKKDRLDQYKLPLGKLETYHIWNFTITRLVPNSKRMEHLQKRVQGPLQKNIYKRVHDRTGKWIYPSNLKKHVLMRFRNSSGKMIEIYDTDENVIIDRVHNDYYINTDMWMMLDTIEETRGTGKRRKDEFIKRLYPEEEYCKYQKVDTIY